MCAGPYAMDLLRLSDAFVDSLTPFLGDCPKQGCRVERQEILKHGFVRLSFPYFMSDADIRYVLDAVELVASEGWRLLPLYGFDAKQGGWFHRQSPATAGEILIIGTNAAPACAPGARFLARSRVFAPVS